MRFISTLIITAILFSSCVSAKFQALKGTYPEPPFQITTQESFDKVWSKVVDVFAERGISIKLIDKSSGIIVSEPTGMRTTIEDKKGVMKNKEAFLVVPSYYDPNAGKYTFYYPADTYRGEITVRVKSLDVNSSSVTINISGVTGQKYMSGKMENGSVLNFKSTGNFEKLFFDLLK